MDHKGSRRFFDFLCETCKDTFEEYVYEDQKEIECLTCNGTAKRVISLPHINWRVMGVDTDFPTAASKWTKAQLRKAREDKGSLRGDRAPNLKMY